MKKIVLFAFIILFLFGCGKGYNEDGVSKFVIEKLESRQFKNIKADYPTLFVEFNPDSVRTYARKKSFAQLLAVEFAIAAKKDFAVVRVIEDNKEILVEEYTPEESYF